MTEQGGSRDPLAGLLTLDSWVTSDQHWEHGNIRAYQGRPHDHFWLMRERWIERVGPSDVLLHLGDVVCFGDRSAHPTWLAGLPGRKLLIRGNHEQHPDAWYEEAGFAVLGPGDRPYYWTNPEGGELVAFSHYPLRPSEHRFDVNVHGHTHDGDPWAGYEPALRANACVERTDYAPVRLRDLLATATLTGTS